MRSETRARAVGAQENCFFVSDDRFAQISQRLPIEVDLREILNSARTLEIWGNLVEKLSISPFQVQGSLDTDEDMSKMPIKELLSGM